MTAQTIPDAHFVQLADLAYSEAGLMIPHGKKSMIHSRLSNRLRRLNIADFGAYHAYVTSPEGEQERKHMISALTTNVTSFFREDHHFNALREDILPELLNKARNGQSVRIWSAGCSSGQEAFSIAMTLADCVSNIGNLDIKILATDIDTNMIATARRGFYSETDVSGIPGKYRDKHLSPASSNNQSGYVMSKALQDLIAFRELNLLSDWPMKKKIDVIFCRNVVIYFDEQTQSKLWEKFKDVMHPEGWLLLGHSERLGDQDIDGMQSVGVTTYRKTTLPKQANVKRKKNGA
ncbi:CheR family methyltransferase [Parasulfitobacter algicola]|uniref:Chemotaxis protein methyltransferase n=1 Tax=Parasulfitobacter algicola TaxID=2614809 RepID=A0ABX2ISG3_9RHOB|nr:protein-glutamate O-methyltransferase [Sulfitobacter algicola]NSX55485.1 protein-glutamate O-methyltransferase [Sulfitobacter algicola]